jgi:hypothetical protein
MSRITARNRQTFNSTLRQKGKDIMLVLPPALKWPHWRAGQRVWFEMRAQTVVISRRPTGPRGRQRYSTRIRHAHVSLVRARAERLAQRLKHPTERVSRRSKSIGQKSSQLSPKNA